MCNRPGCNNPKVIDVVMEYNWLFGHTQSGTKSVVLRKGRKVGFCASCYREYQQNAKYPPANLSEIGKIVEEGKREKEVSSFNKKYYGCIDIPLKPNSNNDIFPCDIDQIKGYEHIDIPVYPEQIKFVFSGVDDSSVQFVGYASTIKFSVKCSDESKRNFTKEELIEFLKQSMEVCLKGYIGEEKSDA